MYTKGLFYTILPKRPLPLYATISTWFTPFYFPFNAIDSFVFTYVFFNENLVFYWCPLFQEHN